MDPEAARFVASLPPDAREVVSALRDVVSRIAPEARETVLWGGLSYHRPKVGGRVKGAVCLIVVKNGRVRLEFIHGVRLSDPDRLLCGDRVSKRYVTVASVADARAPSVARLIRSAATIEWPAKR